MRRILVGFDGSAASVAALRWAVAEGRLHDAKVDAWTAFGPYGELPPRLRHTELVEHDRKALTDLVTELTGDADVHHGVVEGRPAQELVRMSREADLLVVGTRGHSAFEGPPLGAVSRACLHGAHSAVAVVRAKQPVDALTRPVVVGVDGSMFARQALVTAAREARLRGTALHVVHAVYWDHLGGMNPFAPGTDDLVDWGRRLVNAELAEVELGVPLQSFVLPGHPAQVLTRASGRGSLLVIGSHGHGGLSTRLLGSVASHCAAASRCPTLVTRP